MGGQNTKTSNNSRSIRVRVSRFEVKHKTIDNFMEQGMSIYTFYIYVFVYLDEEAHI